MEVKLDHKNKAAPIGRVESMSVNLSLFPVLVFWEGGRKWEKGKEEKGGEENASLYMCFILFFSGS